MKKLFFGVLAWALFSFQGLNANVEEFDDCADFAGLVFQGSINRGMSVGDAFLLANWAYNDCLEMEIEIY